MQPARGFGPGPVVCWSGRAGPTDPPNAKVWTGASGGRALPTQGRAGLRQRDLDVDFLGGVERIEDRLREERAGPFEDYGEDVIALEE